ncbi:DMT family transporter [Phaeobacter sp. S60]|uniref:DMT family transporter n=1 Tax=Phaeobacter sp. S60 TaxID=1569353 RepID=UPI0008DD0087
MKRNIEHTAMVAVAGSGVVWGIYWIPLRALTDAGVSGAWAVFLFYLIPTLLLLPIYFLRWRNLMRGGLPLNFSGMLAGASLVLYAGALIFTDVVQALLLYYLTPLWSTLLARVTIGETISATRWVTIGLGLVGLMIVLELDAGFYWTFNVGDVMGLAAGIVWALAAVRMRSDDKNNGLDFTLSYFAWGSFAALLLTSLPQAGTYSAPDWQTVVNVLPWLVPVVGFLVVPPAFAVMWGATLLSPGLLGILFMTEISAGVVTAAIWAGELFGLREITGIGVISLAGLWEPVIGLVKASPWTKNLTAGCDRRS